MFLQAVFIKKREQDHRAAGIYINNYYANVIKSIKMTWNSKINRRKTLKINTKTSFPKRMCRKCRIMQTRIEQNNDHARIMREIEFWSSSKKHNTRQLYVEILVLVMLLTR